MKNFRLILFIRIVLLVATLLLLYYITVDTELTATLFLLVIISILQFVSLFKYIDTTNKELSRFLLSIKYSDFSQTFSHDNRGKSFSDLNKAFNEVIQKFLETRSETEEQHRYLETIMQHVGVGLISFDNEGDVHLINNAAKKLLKIKHIKNIKALDRSEKGLGSRLAEIRHGEKTTINISDNTEILQLVVSATEFKLREKMYTLISIQNIQSELEEKEMEAWQKLIRVLTHEIMNSITPISSLSGTINYILEHHSSNKALEESEIEDISLAVNTIHRRSEGLINFVNNYRNLTKIPNPRFEIVKVQLLFDSIEKLIESKISENNISFSKRISPETLEITADPNLMEQVFLNLLVNAIHSVSKTENPEIFLSAGLDERGKTVLSVYDNGPGLSEEVMEKIFIPFFTTKKEGSGIGLSLSRQIVRSHGGSIRVSSKPDVETIFTIRL